MNAPTYSTIEDAKTAQAAARQAAVTYRQLAEREQSAERREVLERFAAEEEEKSRDAWLQGANLQRAKFQPLFDLVTNPADWRAPIDATLEISKLNDLGACPSDVADAIAFFTGTHATVESDLRRRRGAVRFTAIGYRAGPCA